jgi:nucleoside-diphosphate-sugar epimerase
MVAITGSTGLLGSELVKKFIGDSIECVGLKRPSTGLHNSLIEYREGDILDVPSLMNAFKGASAVIHTAAVVSFNPKRNKEIYAVNVEGTKNVVDACLALKIPHLIHVSSVAALGREKNLVEIDENAKWVDGPLNTDYAKSKYEAELEVYRGQEEGLNIAIVNPSVILAQSDWRKGSSTLFKYVFDENKFYSAGTFNYVDVRDVVEMISKIYLNKITGKRFIASAGSVKSKVLFEQIATRFGKKAPFILATPFITSVATQIEALRSAFTKREPLVTKQTAKIASETFHYNSQKAINELDMNFKSLEETLDWCCAYYLHHHTTNKY